MGKRSTNILAKLAIIMSTFMGLFKESESGKLSAARVIFLLWSLGVFAIWIWFSVGARELQPVPSSVVTILGLLAGGKTIQKFREQE